LALLAVGIARSNEAVIASEATQGP
jgi:hypothetical protein